jgi:DNA-binding transcriptional LysR family regulator
MNQILALRTFLKIVESKSFSSAATSLSIPNATVTRNIAWLEAHVGVRLLNRTTRSVSLTDAGLEYSKTCWRLIAELDRAEAALSRDVREPNGVLTIAVSQEISRFDISRVVAAFREQYSSIKVEWTSTVSPIDFADDLFDVAIMLIDDIRSTTWVCRELLQKPYGLFAAPAHISRYGLPVSAQELAQHILIGSELDERRRECVLARAGQELRLDVEPVVICSDVASLREAALGGLGICALPTAELKSDIESGRLIHLLPEYEVMREARLALVYPSPKHLSTKVRAFVEMAMSLLGR